MSVAEQSETVYVNLVDADQPGALYRSSDAGRNWEVINRGSELNFKALAVSPAEETILYAGTAGGPSGETNNLWRSDDGGRTWRNFNLSLPGSPQRLVPDVTALVVDPYQPEVLYVGTAGQGVYRFKDGEIGFVLIGGMPLAEAHVKTLTIGAEGQLYALTNGGLYLLQGNSWRALPNLPEHPISLAADPHNRQTLYIGTGSSGAYRTRDGGQSWQNLGTGLGLLPGAALRVTALAVDRSDSQHLVAATAYGLGSQIAPAGIYESWDGGQSWHKVADPTSLVKQVTLNQGVILATTEAGLARYGAEPTIEPGPAGRWGAVLEQFLPDLE
jgi:photosystem II stability/assembly factor-like uncharacterized protein